MANTIHVEVVNAQESIFSGEAKFVALPGESGELGILPRHTPLITRIKPGATEAKKLAEEAMRNAKSDIDLAAAQSEFATMAAQLSAIQKLRKK